jgi:hypothetical protein
MPIPLMDCRYEHLIYALDGYKKTGVALIEYDGHSLLPSLTCDDIGLYCLIPKLATFFGTSLDTSLLLFFYGLGSIAFLSGIVGFFFLYRSWLSRTIAVTGLALLALMTSRFMDVYQLYTVTAVAFMPWILYFMQKKVTCSFLMFSFLTGIGIGTAHYIRTHSGTAVILFFSILAITYVKDTWQKKIALLVCLFLGVAIPAIYFRSTYNAYVRYAQKHLPREKIGESQHPLWHPLYLGFGFLNNPFGIQFDDSVAHKKVMSIDPTILPSDPYPSQHSENLLRVEVVSLIKKHPLFVLNTLFAKVGVLLFYFLLFANFGVIASFLYPLPWQVLLAFTSALAFNSLFVLMTMPFFCYMLGFFSCSTLFGIASINNLVEHWINRKKKV